MSSSLTEADRRRYFRIDDRVGIQYRTLGEDELSQEGEELSPVADTFSLLNSYNRHIDSLLEHLATRDALLAELLQQMDKKINGVIRQLEMDSRLTESLAFQIQKVNISACGLAMTIDEPLAEGSVIELHLLLLPGKQQLTCNGIVVSSSLDVEGGYYTRVDFKGFSAADQETLIQHIVRRQVVQLQRRREAKGGS